MKPFDFTEPPIDISGGVNDILERLGERDSLLMAELTDLRERQRLMRDAVKKYWDAINAIHASDDDDNYEAADIEGVRISNLAIELFPPEAA